MHSPIKYYGGKSSMVSHITDHFPKKKYNNYIEGFGGGASVLLSEQATQLNKGKVEIYNDLNSNVYCVFKCLSNKKLAKWLCEKLNSAIYSERLREEYKQKLKKKLKLKYRAYYFIYVNRTSFNGVGGFSVNRSIRMGICKSVRDFHSCGEQIIPLFHRLRQLVVHNRDIFDLIKKYDNKDVFMYLDPPYVLSTRKSNQKYECEFSDEQHKELIKTLLKCKSKILLSGYDNKIYKPLVKNGWTKIKFKSNNSKTSATEVLWKNY